MKKLIILLHLLSSPYTFHSMCCEPYITFKMSAVFKKIKPLISLCIRWWYKVIIFIFQVLENKETFVRLHIKNKCH